MHGVVEAFTLMVTTPLLPAALLGLLWGVIGGAMPGLSASVTMALIGLPPPRSRMRKVVSMSSTSKASVPTPSGWRLR